MMTSKRLLAVAVSAALYAPLSAFATNGMNMEGYGPISTGMGGASMAFDNGTAAMMNNPATLGMMTDNNQLDVAVGVLSPDVTSKFGSMSAQSGGDSYVMPAMGWAHKSGNLVYGAGVFAQGGMGTEYSASTFMGMGTGQDARSEVGVGRFMIPVAYNVNNQLTVGGSVDLVWGGMDLKMPMAIGTGQPGTFSDFLTGFGGSQVLGRATVSSGLAASMAGAVGAGYDTVAINFSNSNDFTQEASGLGYGAKIGLTYKANSALTFGAAYHMKTAMADWEGNAQMVMYDTNGTNPANSTAGKIKIKDFQWPATIAAGVAFTPNERWLLAADVKYLQWSDTMKNFNMVFTTGGESADITFYQDWSDQTIVNLGGAYKATDAFTVRAGANLASNPIPDKYVNPLFPATIENHYMLGFGYALAKASAVNFSLTYAPEVKVTNPNTTIVNTHSQTNWQLMYSHRF